MYQDIKNYVMAADNADQAAFRLTYAFNARATADIKQNQIQGVIAGVAAASLLFVPGMQIAMLPAVIAIGGYFIDRFRRQNMALKDTFDDILKVAETDADFKHHMRPLTAVFEDVHDWGQKDIARLKEFHFKSVQGIAATLVTPLLYLPALPLVPMIFLGNIDVTASKAIADKSEDIGVSLHNKYPDLKV
jgi:hypothetical protein